MSIPRELSDSARDDALRLAIERCLPIVASIWQDSRWLLLKSRFLPRDPGGELLCIEPFVMDGPSGAPPEPIEIVNGANLGMTFRRGHHKCMFATSVVGRQRIALTPQLRVDALLVRRPDSLQQLQRRAYIRALAPAESAFAVTLAPGSWNKAQHDAASFSGHLIDLSAGGTRIRMNGNALPTPAVGQTYALELRPPGEPIIRVDAIYRHCQVEPCGAQSWGLQLVGLESTIERRAALARIAHLVRNWERSVEPARP